MAAQFQALNENQLRQMLKDPLRKVVDYILDMIYKENESQISQIVYAVYNPDTYERTGEFREAWDTAVHSTSAISKFVEGQFFYKPDSMSVVAPHPANNNMGIHHGIGKNGGDSREYLADIIYQGLSGYVYGNGVWTNKRDAFSALVKYVGKKRFKQWFESGMSEAGLDYKRHGGSISVTVE